MNSPTELSNVVQMTTLPAQQNVSSTALMLDNGSMDKMMRLAEFMASGKSTLPLHLRGSPGDCLAVVMQAVSWNMNPYAVAQKTFVVSGVLGYEAQLVSAVINNSGIVKDRFKFEWFGDWRKVIGKFSVKKNSEGKEFRQPGWTFNDEEGLGIKVWATLRGESEPRVLELLLAQARTRNSTLWADDPKQQLAYLAQKRWARLYASDVILGVYSPDEFDAPEPKDMGQADIMPTKDDDLRGTHEKACREAANKGWAAFGIAFNAIPKDERHLIRDMRQELERIAKEYDEKRTVEPTPAQTINAEVVTDTKPKVNASTGEVVITFDEMIKKLDKATTEDGLYIAMDWSSTMDDQARINELEDHFESGMIRLSRPARA